MSVETVGAVRLSRTIRAEREKVWEAWTRPEHMRLWSCPAPGGVKDVTADLRVGGAFAIHMDVDGQEHNAFGTYREVDPPRRLVYTWDWREEEYAVGETLVTVEFTEVDGGTEVTIVHEGFPAEEARKGHDEGWSACLDHFAGLFTD